MKKEEIDKILLGLFEVSQSADVAVGQADGRIHYK